MSDHSPGVPSVGEQWELHAGGKSLAWGLWQCIQRLETKTFDPSLSAGLEHCVVSLLYKGGMMMMMVSTEDLCVFY